MSETTANKCDNCGAPYEDGLASCAFCDMPIVGRSAGVRCPACSELNTADRRACAMCGAAFTKGCVFCGRVAFLTATACPGCNEAFAGAEQRKSQREAQAKQQQQMQLAQQGLSAVTGFAASQAGQALIGSLVGGGAPSHGGKPASGGGEGLLGQLFDAVIHSNDKNIKR
ncbi:MAG: hypothetical protein U0234_13005 [Sandaracinus sp.]